MAVTQYHPYVNAVQWLGTNITEIRQFIRTSPVITGASVDGGGNLVLALVTPDAPNSVTAANSSLVVPVNNWLVSYGFVIETWSPTDFTARYNVGG